MVKHQFCIWACTFSTELRSTFAFSIQHLNVSETNKMYVRMVAVQCWSTSVLNSQSTVEWQKFYEYFKICTQDTECQALELKIQSQRCLYALLGMVFVFGPYTVQLDVAYYFSILDFVFCFFFFFNFRLQLQMAAGYFLFMNKYLVVFIVSSTVCTSFNVISLLILWAV